MLRVIVVGYGKMLAALIKGAKAKGHEVVGSLRCDRVNYSNFALFFKDIFFPSLDYSFTKSYGIHDIKANSVNSSKFLNEVKFLKADLILVGSWGEKFASKIISVPRLGIINCHPSLLPKHRGANPYFWAIHSGDTKTGVTFHYMDENYDTGDILMQAAFQIEPHMTGETLRNKASKVAEIMVGELLDDIEKEKVVPVVQNVEGNYDKYPYDGIDRVDFNEMAYNIYNKVRGAYPWFYCRCLVDDKMPDSNKTINGGGICGSKAANEKVYKIKKCLPANYKKEWDMFKIGTVIEKKGKLITVKCKDGAIRLLVF